MAGIVSLQLERAARRTRRWVRPDDGMRIELIHIAASPWRAGMAKRVTDVPRDGAQLRLTNAAGYHVGYVTPTAEILSDLDAAGWAVREFGPLAPKRPAR